MEAKRQPAEYPEPYIVNLSVLHAGSFEDTIQDQCHGHGPVSYPHLDVYKRQAPDQERFTRLKTLGVDYTEEALAARIAGQSRPSRQPKRQDGKISLLIDIQNLSLIHI